MTDAAEDLTAERAKTHGDWFEQSSLSNALKMVMRETRNWSTMPVHQREALDMIAVKASRILTGNPAEPDHWDDIGGYAHLGKAGHKP